MTLIPIFSTRPMVNLMVNYRWLDFFKKKNQDICLIPNDINAQKETLDFQGILYGQEDKYGFDFTKKTLSVNVRSQLSSSAKNFDTLYERTFAEALNLHLRCPNMVLGEFYIIAVNEYNSDAAHKKQVKFRDLKNICFLFQQSTDVLLQQMNISNTKEPVY